MARKPTAAHIELHHYAKPWHVIEYDAQGNVKRDEWLVTKHQADQAADRMDPKHKLQRKHEVSG